MIIIIETTIKPFSKGLNLGDFAGIGRYSNTLFQKAILLKLSLTQLNQIVRFSNPPID